MSRLSTILLAAHLKLVTDSSSAGLNGNTILVNIWNLVFGFIKGIVSAIVGAAKRMVERWLISSYLQHMTLYEARPRARLLLIQKQ